MFEGYVTGLVLQYGKKFIKDLPDLKLSVWGGDVELRNLQIRNDVVEQLLPGSGIIVTEGVVRDLRLHIPWTSLTSAPIEIHLDTLELNAVYDPEAAMAAAAANHRKSAQEPKEETLEEPLAPEKASAESEHGWGSWVITKVRNNVAVTVQNLVLRLRYEGYLITLRMDLMDCYSVNYLWERAIVEPGDSSFLRKLCTVEGVTFTVEPCTATGEVTQKTVPVLSKVDLEARVALFGERSHAGLPENRVDILCTSHLAVTISDEQLALLFRVLRMLKSRKRRKAPPKKPTRPRRPVAVAQSAPVVMQHEEKKPAQKGWMSWMWGAVAEDAPTPQEHFDLRQPSVTALSFFVFHCSLNLSTAQGKLLSMVLRHGGVEILSGDVDQGGPSFAFGCEQVRIEEGSTGRVMLEAKSGRPCSANGIFFDSSPSLPFSLFDKRQAVAFAVDVTDVAARRKMIDHEVAFHRYQEGQSIHTIKEQQVDKWVCYDAVFVAFYSSIPAEEGDSSSVAVPSSLVMSFAPKMCMLSFPAIFDVIAFIKHGVAGRSMAQAVAAKGNPAAPERLTAAEARASKQPDEGDAWIEELRTQWRTAPPMKLTLLIAACEVHVPVYEPRDSLRGSGLSPAQRHGSVTLAFLDHQGISFNNTSSFPTEEQLLMGFAEKCHNFEQNLYELTFKSMSFGITHRGSSISAAPWRRTLTLKPTTCKVAFGKGILKSRYSSHLSVTALPLFLSCHRLELALLLSCIPATILRRAWTDEALAFVHSRSSDGKAAPAVDPEEEIVMELRSIEFSMESKRDWKDLRLSLGPGTVSCGSKPGRSIPPIFNLSEQKGAAFRLVARVPRGRTSEEPLCVRLHVRDCELFLVPELIEQWTLSSSGNSDDEHDGVFADEAVPPSRETAPPSEEGDRFAKLRKALRKWELLRQASVEVDINQVLVRSSVTAESSQAFCVFFPGFFVTTEKAAGTRKAWDVQLAQMQLFCEETNEETTEVGHHGIVRALSLTVNAASDHLVHLSAKADVQPLHLTITLEQAQELAAILHRFQRLAGPPRASPSPIQQQARPKEPRLSTMDLLQWAEREGLEVSLNGRLQEVHLTAAAHELLVNDLRFEGKHLPAGKQRQAEQLSSLTLTLAGAKLERVPQEEGQSQGPLRLFDNRLLTCGAASSSAAAEAFLHLSYTLTTQHTSTGSLPRHSVTAAMTCLQVFPWWPSLLDISRFLGFATASLTSKGGHVHSHKQCPPASNLPVDPHRLTCDLRVGEVCFATPALLSDSTASVAYFRVPTTRAEVDLQVLPEVRLRKLSAAVEGGMLYMGALDMAVATAEHTLPPPGSGQELPGWLHPQLANPFRLRLTGQQQADGDASDRLPFLSPKASPREEARQRVRVLVTISPINVRMSKESLGSLLASALCLAKCSTAMRKLLAGSSPNRRQRPPADPSAPSSPALTPADEDIASMVLVLDVPDVEVQLVGAAKATGSRAILLSRVAGLHVTANLADGAVEGFVEDIYVRSVNNDRLSEVVGRRALAGQSLAETPALNRNFATLSTDGHSVVLSLAPCFVSLDAALIKEHLDLADVPDWNTEALLAYDADIKRRQRLMREAAGGEARGHVRRPSDSLPMAPPPSKGKTRVYKLLVPECKVTNAITLAPGISKSSNAVLSALVQEIFVYYAQGQEHCSISVGAIDVGISDSLDEHNAVLQPPVACHISVTEEIHAVTSAL